MARLLSAQLIVTLLLCAQLIDVLTAGAEVCWAELPPRTTGGISPPQLRLTMFANCLRGPMSDRLRPAGCAHHVHIAAVGACEPIAPAEPGRIDLSRPRRCVCPTLVLLGRPPSSRGAYAAAAWAVNASLRRTLIGCSGSCSAGSRAEGQG